MTISAKITETIAVPRNFCDLDNPSDRRRRTFKKSSRNPTTPNPTAANRSANPAGVKRWNVKRDARKPATSPIRITIPPMVGVPIFSRCVCGPSSRIR
jgi:hypothetical protein